MYRTSLDRSSRGRRRNGGFRDQLGFHETVYAEPIDTCIEWVAIVGLDLEEDRLTEDGRRAIFTRLLRAWVDDRHSIVTIELLRGRIIGGGDRWGRRETKVDSIGDSKGLNPGWLERIVDEIQELGRIFDRPNLDLSR